MGTLEARNKSGGAVATESTHGDAISKSLGALLGGPGALGTLLARALAGLVLVGSPGTQGAGGGGLGAVEPGGTLEAARDV